ncbi:deoxyribose-phosphate aldolase, partial [Morganella morganii]|nr:deoxyribose-phosphate aldolase [Morganella morganii]
GKVPVNATLGAAEIMLSVIKEMGVENTVGFKASGGVQTAEEAKLYLDMSDNIVGEGWADNAKHYRFGASSLLSNLLHTLGEEKIDVDAKY